MVLEPDDLELRSPKRGSRHGPADDALRPGRGDQVQEAEPLDHPPTNSRIALAEELIAAADTQHDGSRPDRVLQLASPGKQIS